MSDPVEMFKADRAAQGLGIRALRIEPGEAVLEMTVTEAMTNGHDIAHGGYIFLLADTAFACACNYPEQPATVAAGADISFVSTAKVGEALTARAREQARYGRSGIYDITVSCGDRLVAEFRGRSRTLR